MTDLRAALVALRHVMATAIALAVLLLPRAAFAEPVRILVSAGNRSGLAAERPLKFADTDARRVRDVLISFGGVRAEHAFYLAEPNRDALYAAIGRAKAEAARHRAEEVTLLFYFSGHGDREALHMGGERILITELSAKLAEVPAALRIAVTDACRATRDKGFASDEPFAISATMIPQASGQVWLHASSDGEAAQESDELQGAIFTHAWLTGLRGAADSNGDARVTLEESFAFAHSQTMIRSAKSSGVLQKPEAVVNLHEVAPLVLTQTATNMGTIALPKARDTHFLVYSAGAKSVLSELWGSADRRLLIRVPPGRYVVQKRLGASGGVAQIAIAEGEERKLEDHDFNVSALESVAAKGEAQAAPAPVGESPHELSAGYDVGVSARTGLVHGPRASYAYAWTNVALTVGAAAEFADWSLTDKDEKLTSGYGRAAIEPRLPIGSVLVFRAGAGARAGVVSQSIVPTNGAAAAPNAIDQTQRGFFLGPEVVLAGRAALGRTWFLDVAATGAMAFLREEGETRGVSGLTGAGSLGARF